MPIGFKNKRDVTAFWRVSAIGLIFSLAAACQFMPKVVFHNTTTRAVAIRFQEAKAAKFHAKETYDLKPGQPVRFPAGYLYDSHLVVVTSGCTYTFSGAVDDLLSSDVKPLTRFAFGSDMKLYVWNRKSPVQPKGWPLSAMSKVCR